MLAARGLPRGDSDNQSRPQARGDAGNQPRPQPRPQGTADFPCRAKPGFLAEPSLVSNRIGLLGRFSRRAKTVTDRDDETRTRQRPPPRTSPGRLAGGRRARRVGAGGGRGARGGVTASRSKPHVARLLLLCCTAISSSPRSCVESTIDQMVHMQDTVTVARRAGDTGIDKI